MTRANNNNNLDIRYYIKGGGCIQIKLFSRVTLACGFTFVDSRLDTPTRM